MKMVQKHPINLYLTGKQKLDLIKDFTNELINP